MPECWVSVYSSWLTPLTVVSSDLLLLLVVARGWESCELCPYIGHHGRSFSIFRCKFIYPSCVRQGIRADLLYISIRPTWTSHSAPYFVQLIAIYQPRNPWWHIFISMFQAFENIRCVHDIRPDVIESDTWLYIRISVCVFVGRRLCTIQFTSKIDSDHESFGVSKTNGIGKPKYVPWTKWMNKKKRDGNKRDRN